MKYIAIILGLTAAALAQQPDSQVFESYISQHLSAQHVIESAEPGSTGQCEEYKKARMIARGDLNNDGTPDTAIVYTLEGGGLGNNAAQYLAVFVRSKAGHLKAVARWEVNDSRGNAISSVVIRDNVIYLKGLQHTEHDAMCCPTGKFAAQYALVGNRLLQIVDPQ